MGQEKKKSSSFVQQAAILAVAGILVKVFGFLYRLPLTNMIGDEGNGIYSAGYYLYSFFLVLSSAGIPAAISKMISERVSLGEYSNVKRILKVSFWISGSVGAICSLVMFFGAQWFCDAIKSPRSYYAILTLSPTIFVVALLAVFRGFFQGLGTMVPTAVSQVVEQIFNAIFSVLLAYLWIGKGVEYGAAGGTTGTGIGAFAALVFAFVSYIILKESIYKSLWKKRSKKIYKKASSNAIAAELVKITVPIITGSAIFSITNLIDMQMVSSRLTDCGAFTEAQITALYGQLTGKYVTITAVPIALSASVATAVIPSIAASNVRRDRRAVRDKIRMTIRLTMILTIPSAVGMGILGSEILKMLFPNYAEGGSLFLIGIGSIVFLALSQIVTGILQGIGKVHIPAINALIGALVKIPINYFLIVLPYMNVKGAIISTTACYCVAASLNLLALVKYTGVTPDFMGAFIKPTASAVIMAIGCRLSYDLLFYLTSNNMISTLLAIAFGIIVYIGLLAVMKGLKKDDVLMMPMGRKLVVLLERFKMI